MRAVELKTEHLTNPIGIDIVNPRFFWKCEGGIRQSAYEIVCRKVCREDEEGEIIWSTGKCESDKMTYIAYAGKPLASGEKVDWSVRLWDENDEPGEWSAASFEMGLLKKEDWRGRWICGNYKVEKNKRYPVDCFQSEFSVKSSVIKRARLYITACGLYEARLNGTKVGEFCLAPGSTDYRKRIQYQTYDVTKMLTSKEKNRLEIGLADGWYRGSVAAHGFVNAYGKETKLLFQLVIDYENSDSQVVMSSENTRWSNDGPIRFADLKDGEVVDARKAPSYGSTSRLCKKLPTGKLVSGNNVYPKAKEAFSATMIKTPSGKTVLDFGQNVGGFLSFKVKGKEGDELRIRLGEILDENGEFTQKNFQVKAPAKDVGAIGEIFVISDMSEKITKEIRLTPLQQITYTCNGKKDEYTTKFAVFGFQYILIESESVEVNPADFKAVAVYSDMEQTGTFSCSNEKVNQFYKNTVWSMKGNYLDVPTDCPTRERLGWTGDAQVFFNAGSYMMNTASFFRKWLHDVEDAQDKKGMIPAVMPFSRGATMYDTTGTSVGWADVIYLVPYRYYLKYGDEQILRDYYPMMEKYAKHIISLTGHKDKKAAKADPYNKYVYEKGFHLGEWLEPEEFMEKINASSAGKFTRVEEATAYFHLTMETMAEIAKILGRKEDERLFAEYAKGSKKAYANNFLNPVPDTDRQAKLVRPLALGCVPEEQRRAVAERLFAAVENRGFCIGTGFLSTPFVLKMLTENGRVDLAYKMLENEAAPSWLFEVNAGATTVWEDWEGKASRNHYSPGAVCEWMYDTILGIKVDAKRHFTIAPIPGGTLTHAKGSYNSIYGEVKVSWTKEDEGLHYEIVVPGNTTATIIIDGVATEAEAGTYRF